MKRVESASLVQVAAQEVMLDRFGRMIQKELRPNQILLDNAYVNVDGYHESDQEIVLAECWAHVGKAKVAQKHKIAADILKLSLASAYLRKKRPDKAIRCYIVFADKAAAEVLGGASWMAAAAKAYGVSPSVVTLDTEMLESIKRTQKAQDLRTIETTTDPLE